MMMDKVKQAARLVTLLGQSQRMEPSVSQAPPRLRTLKGNLVNQDGVSVNTGFETAATLWVTDWQGVCVCVTLQPILCVDW